jgi:hypothetical protein
LGRVANYFEDALQKPISGSSQEKWKRNSLCYFLSFSPPLIAEIGRSPKGLGKNWYINQKIARK